MINIYKLDESTGLFAAVSVGDFSNPVGVSVIPGGSAVVKKLFLRNDNVLKYYTDIVLRPATLVSAAISSTAVSVKLLSGDAEPSADRWTSVAANGPADGVSTDPAVCSILQSPLAGGSIDTRLPELGTSTEADVRYYPFWIRIEVLKGVPFGNLDVTLKISYTEGNVV